MKNKIIVTGASGFIGLNLIDYIKKNINSTSIQTIKLRYNLKQSFSFKSNVIIHLAGIAHDSSNNINEKKYFESNYLLTKQLFDYFKKSNSKIFIYFSSTKVVSDSKNDVITENSTLDPIGPYSKSKYLSEKYILSQNIMEDKKVYILRPSMVYGKYNKGNLNLLFNYLKHFFFWPLGIYKNKRTYCSIENINFIIENLLKKKIKSGIYNICDDNSISTNNLIKIISRILNKRIYILKFPKIFINNIFRIIGYFGLSYNLDFLHKIVGNYEVSNAKIKKELKLKNLPTNTIDSFKSTFRSFK